MQNPINPPKIASFKFAVYSKFIKKPIMPPITVNETTMVFVSRSIPAVMIKYSPKRA